MEAAPAKFRSLCNSFARILRTCSTARVRDRESAHPNDVRDDPDRFDDHGRLVGRDRFSEATRSPKLVGVVAVAGRGLCLVQSAGPNQRPVVHRGWQRLHHSLCGALHSRSLPVSSAPLPVVGHGRARCDMHRRVLDLDRRLPRTDCDCQHSVGDPGTPLAGAPCAVSPQDRGPRAIHPGGRCRRLRGDPDLPVVLSLCRH